MPILEVAGGEVQPDLAVGSGFGASSRPVSAVGADLQYGFVLADASSDWSSGAVRSIARSVATCAPASPRQSGRHNGATKELESRVIGCSSRVTHDS